MKFTHLLASFVITAGVALAQVPQGLGAADPSQQLKSMGMDPTQPGFVLGAPIVEEPAQPLITVIEERRQETRAQARARMRAEQRARVNRRVDKADRVRIIDDR